MKTQPIRTCAYKPCGLKFTPVRNKEGPMFCGNKCRVMNWREEQRKAKKGAPKA